MSNSTTIESKVLDKLLQDIQSIQSKLQNILSRVQQNAVSVEKTLNKSNGLMDKMAKASDKYSKNMKSVSVAISKQNKDMTSLLKGMKGGMGGGMKMPSFMGGMGSMSGGMLGKLGAASRFHPALAAIAALAAMGIWATNRTAAIGRELYGANGASKNAAFGNTFNNRERMALNRVQNNNNMQGSIFQKQYMENMSTFLNKYSGKNSDTSVLKNRFFPVATLVKDGNSKLDSVAKKLQDKSLSESDKMMIIGDLFNEALEKQKANGAPDGVLRGTYVRFGKIFGVGGEEARNMLNRYSKDKFRYKQYMGNSPDINPQYANMIKETVSGWGAYASNTMDKIAEKICEYVVKIAQKIQEIYLLIKANFLETGGKFVKFITAGLYGGDSVKEGKAISARLELMQYIRKKYARDPVTAEAFIDRYGDEYADYRVKGGKNDSEWYIGKQENDPNNVNDRILTSDERGALNASIDIQSILDQKLQYLNILPTKQQVEIMKLLGKAQSAYKNNNWDNVKSRLQEAFDLYDSYTGQEAAPNASYKAPRGGSIKEKDLAMIIMELMRHSKETFGDQQVNIILNQNNTDAMNTNSTAQTK